MPYLTKLADHWAKLTDKEKLEWGIVLIIIIPTVIIPICWGLTSDNEDSASSARVPSSPVTTKESGCTEEEDAYFDVVLPALADIIVKQTELQEISTGTSNDPFLIIEREWQDRFNEIINAIESQAIIIMNINPPPSLDNIHNDLEQMSNHLRKMSSVALTGLELLDADMLTNANDEKVRAYGYMDKAFAKIENFCL